VGTIVVEVKCDQGASVTLTGTLTELLGKKRRHGKQRGRRFQLVPTKAPVTAGIRKTLALKLPKAALTDLAHGAKESVALALTAANGNGTSQAAASVPALRGS
jgi:hypothetical protein